AQPQQLHCGRVLTGELGEAQQPCPGDAGWVFRRVQSSFPEPPRQYRVAIQVQVTADRYRLRVDVGSSLGQCQRKIAELVRQLPGSFRLITPGSSAEEFHRFGP